MRTERKNIVNIQHKLADISVKLHQPINKNKLKQLINLALNSYSDEETIPAKKIHQEAKDRHGSNYQTAGYFLKLYRNRSGLTQVELANLVACKQHHISEMENNKRPIGKKLAKKLAESLLMDYRKLL